jgi:hypothetical protein
LQTQAVDMPFVQVMLSQNWQRFSEEAYTVVAAYDGLAQNAAACGLLRRLLRS